MTFKKLKLLFIVAVFVIGSTSVARAQELVLTSTPEVSVTPAAVGYQLPYPGLLPGHPFYQLKIFRDKLMSILISNPVKKAEFDLLQSDKRFEAAHVLVLKGKIDVAKNTLSKAQNYFEEAIDKAADARKEGMDIHALATRLALADEKHREVLKTMEEKVGPGGKKKFMDEKNREAELTKKVKQLKP